MKKYLSVILASLMLVGCGTAGGVKTDIVQEPAEPVVETVEVQETENEEIKEEVEVEEAAGVEAAETEAVEAVEETEEKAEAVEATEVTETEEKEVAKTDGGIYSVDEVVIQVNEDYRYIECNPGDWIPTLGEVFSAYNVNTGEPVKLQYEGAYHWSTKLPGYTETSAFVKDSFGNVKKETVTLNVKKPETWNQPAQDNNNYSAPASSGNVVNFDNSFWFVDMGYDPSIGAAVQANLDANGIVRYFGDYGHHNNPAFRNLFWKAAVPGTTVIIGGQTYTSGGAIHCADYYTNFDSYNYYLYNGITEIKTCDTGDGQYILTLY